MFSYLDLPEGNSQSESDVLTTLTSHGGAAFQPGYTEYVIHTHSVPLASTVDMHYLREGGSTLFHGFEAGNKGIECPKRTCMYIDRNGNRKQEKIAANCPCRKLRAPDGSALMPRCFLTYVKSLGRLLASEHEESEAIDPKRIMFCQTSVSLFDNKYPGWFRDELGVTGWEHVTNDYLTASLHSLYWYRKYNRTLGLDNSIEKAMDRLGLRQARHAITQAIHTINGIIIKKFMAFCSETVRYADYAKQTAYLFRDLLHDYLLPVQFKDGKPVEPEGTTYMELKAFLNDVKQCFHRNSFQARKAWLEYNFQSKSLRRIFNEITKLKALVEVKHQEGADYTESPAWIFRCTTLCQTRVLGYLPLCIAEVKRKQFRENVSRPLELPPKENLRLIKASVIDELTRCEIPRGFMGEPVWASDVARERFKEAMAAIELPLKGAASVDSFVREGGKIEDARQLINLAIDNKWEIPVRDLSTHAVIHTFCVSRIDDHASSDYVRPLFWLSYTLILNWFIAKGFIKGVDKYPLLLEGNREYLPDPLRASVVHISEPGKERNLTKSTGILTWFLTPASKIVQDTIALIPEHTVGLRASNHEWRHQKRISSKSDESSFIYDILTGSVKPRVIHSFKDWTESTDFIGKLVGWAHLEALLDYIAFPVGYKLLIAHAILEPQPVTEVINLKNIDDEIEYEPVQWTGFIREGFMMGNPMTKGILHLIHVSERNVTRAILARHGVQETTRGPYLGLGDSVHLDRTKTGAKPSVHIRS